MPRNIFDTEDDLDRSRPVDFDLRLPRTTEALTALAEEAQATMRPDAVRSTLRKTTVALDCLIANLVRVHAADARSYLGVGLRDERFSQSRYLRPPAGADIFRRAVSFLRDRRPALITFKRGFSDRVTRVGRVTKIRATPALISMLPNFGLGPPNGDGTSFAGVAFLRRAGNEEIIRLKNESKKLIPYDDIELTRVMRTRLAAWNRFASFHWIDLAVPNTDHVGYLTPKDSNLDDEPTETQRRNFGHKLPDFTANRLYRIFNQSSFEIAGRMYGGWWQSLSKAFRSRITINEQPTREVDFSGMHIALLYAEEGVALQGDPYEIEGIDRSYRPVVKQTFLTMINALTGQQTKQPPRNTLPMDWDSLQTKIRQRHEPIRRHFNSDAGRRLQRIDSEIAERIMIRMGQRGVLVLPVHDSFVAPHTCTDDLKSEMARAFSEMSGSTAGTEIVPSFFDHDNYESTDDVDLTPEEVVWTVFDNQAFGYSNYWSRRQSFMSAMGEERYHQLFGCDCQEATAPTVFDGLPDPPTFVLRPRG